MIYFTSDLHLGHRAIIRMQNRPFIDVDEMNAALIRNINEIVQPDDKLYILGDIAHHIDVSERERLIRKIRCRNRYLIMGNHDRKKPDGTPDIDPALFKWIKDYHKESLNGTTICLMHYPLLSWDKMRAGSIMLHGHIHADETYNLQNIENGICRFDVGVDANQYKPVSIKEVLGWAEEARKNNTGFGSL